MEINLKDEIARHYNRLNTLAEEALLDEEQSYSSRSSAMTALSSMLRELTKIQESIINMERLMIIEQTTIETVRDHLTEDQHEKFINDLQQRLNS